MAFPPSTLLRSSLAAATAFVLLGQGLPAQEKTFSDRDEVVHVLNRITFGPRPGDVEAVEKMGLQNYIQQQLHPETIDDSAVDQALAGFDILQMTSPQLSQLYLEERKKGLKKQKELAARRAAQLAAQMPNSAATAMSSNTAAAPAPAAPATVIAPVMPTPSVVQTPPAAAGTADLSAEPMTKTAANGEMTPAPAAGENDVQPPPPQIEPATPLTPKGRLDAAVEKAKQYRTVAAIGELEQAKIVRAIESPRQLQEVLVDFWGNHFNIDMKKGLDRVYKVADDRDVIRPHIWGSFRDLLEASAKSPAMLFYLDNDKSTVARTVSPAEVMITDRIREQMTANGNEAIAPPPAVIGQKKGGLNENYGREIMELHTLGVDGGYTQSDVQEVARCFTGWGIDRKTGTFAFHARQHDNGQKVVLGHVIPAGGGMQDGETVLDILASSPACAHHIAYQMCQRFVSDDPPEALVKRVAAVFTQSNGNLRAVTESILTSPEFLSPADYNTKIKSPLEFAVSAVRATESTITPQQSPPFDKLVPAAEGAAVLGRGAAADRIAKRPRQSLNWHIYDLGEPLFAYTAPTGYKEASKFWVSPGALIERLNFALALTQQKVADVKFDAQNILKGADLDNPQAVLKQSVDVLLQNNISDTTRKVLQQSALPTGESKTVDPTKLIALIIGSPEFQRK